MEVFTPLPKGSKHLSASSTTARVELRKEGQPLRVVTVYHSLGEELFGAFGGSSITATTGAAGYDQVIPSGQLIRLRVPDGATHFAGVTASASGTVYISTGGGG
jgi:hypothetical protein